MFLLFMHISMKSESIGKVLCYYYKIFMIFINFLAAMAEFMLITLFLLHFFKLTFIS